jgi:hypothetical protein
MSSLGSIWNALNFLVQYTTQNTASRFLDRRVSGITRAFNLFPIKYNRGVNAVCQLTAK